MADIIKTIGTGGDYADPILWAAAEGAAYTTDRAVGEVTENIAMSSLFRPNQAFTGGGLLRGNKTVTGKTGDGWTLSNTSGARVCLAPSDNLDFEDLEWDLGANTYTIQNSGNNTLTRCLMPNGFIYYTADKSLTLNNSLLADVDGLVSTTQGNVTLSNTTVTDRLIIRAETLLTILNSNSIANDWLLGRGAYTNSETLVNYCYIKQNAPASDFGTGSSNNTINTDTTAEMVNFAGGDYRIKSTSTLATAGQGGTFIGAFLEASSGLTASITESKASRSNSSSLLVTPAVVNSISIIESRASRLNSSSVSFSIDLSVNEDKQARLNSSSLSVVSPGNLSLSVSEVRQSRENSSSFFIPESIGASAAEIRSARYDISSLKAPITIAFNAKNLVKVKRKSNNVKIKRKTNVIRIK